MAYRRIVVATDGSESAETAETIASTLASIGGANLTNAHAYGNPERANEAVARAEQIADREGARHELALSAEPPADAILMTADEKEAELIVIGSVGFSTSDQLFGSVSRRGRPWRSRRWRSGSSDRAVPASRVRRSCAPA